MPMTKEKRLPTRTLSGWAVAVLSEAHAIRECEDHGWMRDRADPHARDRAILVAQQDPPAGVSVEQAIEAIKDALSSIGDTCPEC
jgi:hypothetical protein